MGIENTSLDKTTGSSHSACESTSYRWLKTGDPAGTGHHSFIHTINVTANITAASDGPGEYTQWALCRNSAGAVVDTALGRVVVEMVSVPRLRHEPKVMQVGPGDTIIFDVREQLGDFFGPVKYQWEKNGQPVPWAVSRTLKINHFDPDVHGYGTYTCLLITPTGSYRWKEFLLQQKNTI